MSASIGIAGKAGRWSARHPWTAISLWIAFVAAAIVIGSAVGTKELTEAESASGESGVAARTLDKAGFKLQPGEQVIVQSKTLKAGDPAFRAVVSDVINRLESTPNVVRLRSPYAQNTISKDGHSALVSFEIPGTFNTVSDKVEPIQAATAAVQKAHPDFLIAEAGDGSFSKAYDDTQGKDFEKAEQLSLPITLLILVIAFGGLLIAGIPVALAMSAVLAALGLTAVASQLLPVTDVTQSVILLIGLAVGVDYSIFYIARERQERAKGVGRRRRDRDRRGHVRPRRARLRPDRHGRHERHVPGRQRRVLGHRPGHDPGRRHRDHRLADRAAGAARAQVGGLPRPHPGHRPVMGRALPLRRARHRRRLGVRHLAVPRGAEPAPARPRRAHDLAARPHARAPAPGHLGRRLGGDPGRPRAPGRRPQARPGARGLRDVEEPAGDAGEGRDRQGLPGLALARRRRDRGQGRDDARRSRRRSRTSSRRPSRAGTCSGPSRCRSRRITRSRGCTRPSRATATTTRPWPRCRRCATRSCRRRSTPARASRRRASPARPRAWRTSTR